MFRRANADLPTKLVSISIQEGREDLTKHAIDLGTIFGDPCPHRGEGVGKVLCIAAVVSEFAFQTTVSFGEPIRGRVVSGGKPAVCGARDATKAGFRAPASDPKRYAVLLPGRRRKLEIGRRVVEMRGL